MSDPVFTGVCFAIEYRLDFRLRFTRHEISGENKRASLAAPRGWLTLVDSEAYESEFPVRLSRKPLFESRLPLIGLMKLRFMTDSRCHIRCRPFSLDRPLLNASFAPPSHPRIRYNYAFIRCHAPRSNLAFPFRLYDPNYGNCCSAVLSIASAVFYSPIEQLNASISKCWTIQITPLPVQLWAKKIKGISPNGQPSQSSPANLGNRILWRGKARGTSFDRAPPWISKKGREKRSVGGRERGSGSKIEVERLECSLLTSDLNRGWLPSNLTWSRPCHALALEPLPTEVLLDLVPRHVQLDLDDPRPGTRVDKILVLRSLCPFTVTPEVHLRTDRDKVPRSWSQFRDA